MTGGVPGGGSRLARIIPGYVLENCQKLREGSSVKYFQKPLYQLERNPSVLSYRCRADMAKNPVLYWVCCRVAGPIKGLLPLSLALRQGPVEEGMGP